MVAGLFEKIKSQARERRLSKTLFHKYLGNKGISCEGCPGRCCTFELNSMRVTLLEALEIYVYLKERGEWEKYLQKSHLVALEDRLWEGGVGNGDQEFLRRKYTCPLYLSQGRTLPQGGVSHCELSRDHRPLGCLGYNPQLSKTSDLERFCRPQGKADEHEDQDFLFHDPRFSQLQGEFPRPIPVALVLLGKVLSPEVLLEDSFELPLKKGHCQTL